MLGIMRYNTAVIQYNPSETFKKKKKKKKKKKQVNRTKGKNKGSRIHRLPW